MKEHFIYKLANLSLGELIIWLILLTIVIETITLIFRFGFDLQSTRDTLFIAHITFDIRIHHGYIGLLMLIFVWLSPMHTAWQNFTIILGGALVASDFIHHFLILWPITGSPEFNLTYLKRK